MFFSEDSVRNLSTFQPGEVEFVIETAADQMDHPVRALGGGHISPRLRVCLVHLEELGPRSAVQEAGDAVRHQLPHGPRFPLVVGEGRIQPEAPVRVALFIREDHAPLALGSPQRVVGERDQQEGAFPTHVKTLGRYVGQWNGRLPSRFCTYVYFFQCSIELFLRFYSV